MGARAASPLTVSTRARLEYYCHREITKSIKFSTDFLMFAKITINAFMFTFLFSLQPKLFIGARSK